MSKERFYKIDYLRFIAVISILFYHMGILPGGYLAVCTFFVLSGFLTTISAFQKENFSMKEYYINRFKKIYIPLLIVVFTTIGILSFFKTSNWMNLKPETTSVLFSYNNYWQLSANLDYFTRHVASPFMHLWYISILVQFELVFPILFLGFKRLGEKLHKSIPCLFLLFFSILGAAYFYKLSLTKDIMMVYYDTTSRIFSLFFGMTAGFVYHYYHKLTSKEIENNNTIYLMHLLFLIVLFIFVDAKNVFFAPSMIATTILSFHILGYSMSKKETKIKVFEKVSMISYEIYLIQYPVIFFFQNIPLETPMKVGCILITVMILSFLLHFALKKNTEKKNVKVLVLILFLISSAYGVYHYVVAKDHTEEMQELKEQLKFNEEMLSQKQAEYALKAKEEEDKWKAVLENLDNEEEKIKDMVKNMRITFVGDSVMLGAMDSIYEFFPNAYVDAAISRTAWVANGILQGIKAKGMLGDAVVFNLGANGDCPLYCKQEILRTIGDKKVFFITATNDQDVHVNATMRNLSNTYSNVYVIDWEAASKGHKEYFTADQIHLVEQGKSAYTKTIYDALYQVYLEEYQTHKEELIKEYQEKEKNKLTFYGNDLLLNAYDLISKEYKDARMIINKDFNFESLKEEIKSSLDKNLLSYKIVFLFDSTVKLTDNQYQEIIELCKNRTLYFVLTAEVEEKESSEKVHWLLMHEKLYSNRDNLMSDQIHLTEQGNQELVSKIKEALGDDHRNDN